MANADVQLNKSYSVEQGEITFSLTIGEGQHGVSSVFLNGQKLLTVSGTIGALRLGNGVALQGKNLIVRSVVNDVLSETNRMSITYRLRGGPKDGDFRAPGEVKQEGDLLIFEATFALTA